MKASFFLAYASLFAGVLSAPLVEPAKDAALAARQYKLIVTPPDPKAEEPPATKEKRQYKLIVTPPDPKTEEPAAEKEKRQYKLIVTPPDPKAEEPAPEKEKR